MASRTRPFWIHQKTNYPSPMYTCTHPTMNSVHLRSFIKISLVISVCTCIVHSNTLLLEKFCSRVLVHLVAVVLEVYSAVNMTSGLAHTAVFTPFGSKLDVCLMAYLHKYIWKKIRFSITLENAQKSHFTLLRVWILAPFLFVLICQIHPHSTADNNQNSPSFVNKLGNETFLMWFSNTVKKIHFPPIAVENA